MKTPQNEGYLRPQAGWLAIGLLVKAAVASPSLARQAEASHSPGRPGKSASIQASESM